MNTIARRIAAGAALVAAPALIALGAAAASHADTSVTNTGPSVSSQHRPFPHQDLSKDKPGTPAHHHHQWHHAQ
jgi:hypothetical protein